MGAVFSIFSLLNSASSFITGAFSTINGVTKMLGDAKIAQINATTAEEKIHADERVATLSARRDLMVAEAAAGSRINLWVRVAFATGPIFVLDKIYIWDKGLGQWTGGHTDALDPNLWNVIMVQLGFYFLYEGSIAITRIIKSR